jgi:hypothetical protein
MISKTRPVEVLALLLCATTASAQENRGSQQGAACTNATFRVRNNFVADPPTLKQCRQNSDFSNRADRCSSNAPDRLTTRTNKDSKRRFKMDLLYIPALASFSGSASGTLASIVTGWVTQRRKDRLGHRLRTTSQREGLYKSFIEEASRLYADALVNDKSEVSKLVGLYALIARMKILSSDAVIEAAEKAGRLILETYLSPNRTFVDLPGLIEDMDPLRDFSEACRRELQSVQQR